MHRVRRAAVRNRAIACTRTPACTALARTSALWLDWPLSGLGIWLLAVAGAAGFAGPVGIWAVGSLAGGLASR